MALSKGTMVNLGDDFYSLSRQIQGDEKGAVWVAEGPDGTENYVIKFVKAQGEKKARFEKEFLFCERIQNKHVVRVYGHSEFDGLPFYVMPRYPKTLRDIITEEKDPFRLLDYIIQLCTGLKFIHDNSIIHRDIKPENIFVDSLNNLVIADFGIAHFENSTQTRAGAWMGNKRYAAPEQIDQNKSDLVTSACDIYALGRIINELYTKNNPAGSQYAAVADTVPLFFSLDSVIYRCLLHDPLQRPTISDVLTDVLLIRKELSEKLQDIQDFLFPDEDTEFTDEEIEEIVTQASQDILTAQNLFYCLSEDKWESLNNCYHNNLWFDTDATIKNLYYQRKAFEYCREMFNYESNIYQKDAPYLPIDLNKQENADLFDELVKKLDAHSVPRKFTDLTGKVLKYFSSCCDYHCRELLEKIRGLDKRLADLDCSPILYIVSVLKSILPPEELRKLELSDHLMISWGRTTLRSTSDEEYLFDEDKDDESCEILNELQVRFGAIYGRLDSKHFYVKFPERACYDRFTSYALLLAKPYYVFEGDVLSIIKVWRETEDIIELEPLDNFDITVTLAKILGFREIIN